MDDITKHLSLGEMLNQGAEVYGFAGPGGVGKGTLAELLELALAEFYPHRMVVSDLIKSYKNEDSKIGDRIRTAIAKFKKNGDLSANLDDEPVIEMVFEEMWRGFVNGKRKFLYDGFPRSLVQAKRIAGARAFRLFHLKGDADLCLKQAALRKALDIANGRKPREDDEPHVVIGRSIFFEKVTLPGIKVIQRIRNDAVIEIDGFASLKKKAAKALRSMGLDHLQYREIMSRFDNPDDELAKFVDKIQNPHKHIKATQGACNLVPAGSLN